MGKRKSTFLWEFLLQLLDGNNENDSIAWINRSSGVFVLNDQNQVAKLWGQFRGRPRMNKLKLGRALRYHYKTGILEKVSKQKGVYRFIKQFNELEKKSTTWCAGDDLPEIDLNDDSVLSLIGDGLTTKDTPSVLLDACELFEGDDMSLDDITLYITIYNELFQMNYKTESANVCKTETQQTFGGKKDDFMMEKPV